MAREYAQSYPQLILQALRAGYDDAELGRLKRAHDLAVRLVHGFYRGQGSPFIDHLVRTASIVLEEKETPASVRAALLHAAYAFGRFGDGRQGGRSAAHKRELLAETDAQTEELIYLYDSTELQHPAGTLQAHLERLDGYSDLMKQALVMRLCNELEDYLDLGMVLRGQYPYREAIERDSRGILDLARRLGRKQLASELEEAFRFTLQADLPASVRTGRRDAYELPSHRDMRRGPLVTGLARIKRKIRAARNGPAG